MAAPAKQRPGRSLGMVALVLVALYLGVFLGPAQTPALGLDLRGGTEITLTASPLAGGKVTKSALKQAVGIIRDRANGLGVTGATVSAQGSNNIVVQVPKKGRSVLETIGQTALLRFRQVLTFGAGVPVPATTTSPSPSTSPSAKPSSKTSPKAHSPKTHSTPKASSTAKSSKSSGRALSSVLTKGKAATPSPTATPSADSDADCVVRSEPYADPNADPNGYVLSGSRLRSADPAAARGASRPRSRPRLRSRIRTGTACKNPNPTNGNDNPDWYIISCSDGQDHQVPAGAGCGRGHPGDRREREPGQPDRHPVGRQPQLQRQRVVGLADGHQEGLQRQPGSASSQTCSPPTGCNAVAIVLDGIVQSAPYIVSRAASRVARRRSPAASRRARPTTWRIS